MTTPYYAMKTHYPPGIIQSSVDGKRYAVAGSTWLEIGPEVTQKELQEAWTPLKAKTVQPKIETKHFTVKSSRPGVEYNVTQFGEYWSCSCPGFEFYKKCKHITQQKVKV
jgi:hypothetical protein